MINALWTGATGMTAQEQNINVISNNLANTNTAGFKKGRVDFADLLYQTMRQAGAPTAANISNPVGLQSGHGVRSVATMKIFSQGDMQNTDNPLDLTISGDGFFKIRMPDGSEAYTRDGSFKRDAEGNIVTALGYFLDPPITIPETATDINVGTDGSVSYLINNEVVAGGQIQIVRFQNNAGLSSFGDNLYKRTPASGPEIGPGIPGTENRGTIIARFLESSNVKAVEEIVRMIIAQRAYELNSKSIQTSDAMLQVVNGLKR